MYHVYILRCSDNSLYTGIAADLAARLQRHRQGKGAKYMRTRLPFELVYVETVQDKSTALKREFEIKKLSKSDKELLCSQFIHPQPRAA